MLRSITPDRIQILEEYFDDRLDIMINLSQGNPADKAYYHAMITTLRILGWDVVKRDGHHHICNL